MHTLVGPLPKHVYCWADRSFFRDMGLGFEPVIWFGLVSFPGRAWGCTVLTEDGAVYRNLPPHALAFREDPRPRWSLDEAQRWNCYGERFTALEYPTLAGLPVWAKAGRQKLPGHYLFTAAPVGDPYTAAPDQAKEFSFIALGNGRLTIQPTDRVLFRDASFTVGPEAWPADLVKQRDVWVCSERSK